MNTFPGMNKYKVNRVLTKGDFTTASQDYIVFAKSAEQAISHVRYKQTKSDKMPNGEPTDYVDDDGYHVTWKAVSIDPPAPELDPDELDDLDTIMKEAEEQAKKSAVSVHDIAKRYMELFPGRYKDIASARRIADAVIKEQGIKPVNDKKRNRLFAKADANLIIRRMLHGNTFGERAAKPASKPASWVAPAPRNEPAPVKYELPEDTETRLGDMVKVLETTREKLITRAVVNYLDELYDMTVNELFTLKEALHNG